MSSCNVAMFSSMLLALNWGLISKWDLLYMTWDQLKSSDSLTIDRTIYSAHLLLFLGIICGSLSFMKLMSFQSRYRRLFVALIPAFIHWFAVILLKESMSQDTISILNFCRGYAIGLIETVLPIYVAEISADKSRGKSCIAVALWAEVGVALLFIADSYYIPIAITGIVCIVLLFAYVILFCCISDSPYFLILSAYKEEAARFLISLHGETEGLEQLAIIESTVATEKACSGSCYPLMKGFLIMSFLAACSELGGADMTNWVLHLMSTMYVPHDDVDDERLRNIITPCLIITKLVALALTMALIDKIGRRAMLHLSGVFASLSTTVIAMLSISQNLWHYRIRKYNLVVSGLIILYTFAMTLGAASVSLVLISELFSTKIRLRVSAALVVVKAILCFLNTFIWASIMSSGRYYYILILYSFVLIVMSLVITILLPETKRKNFAEIQVALG